MSNQNLAPEKINILITGANGFMGKNVSSFFESNPKYNVSKIIKTSSDEELFFKLKSTHFIFHLAGVNRPETASDFQIYNTRYTQKIIDYLIANNCNPVIIFASSIHAEGNTPYGLSKRACEELLYGYSSSANTSVFNYRLTNTFGKWGKPNYNSVVATFCYNIAHDLPISINDASSPLNLVYIDDVVKEFSDILECKEIKYHNKEVFPKYNITLGELANTISSFKELRSQRKVPDFSNTFTKKLYSTFLSYLPKNKFSNTIELHADERGNLFELIKSENAGQIFVSTTKPGITRGNHYHHTKVEKFCVLKGDAIINFRNRYSDEVISYPVSGVKIEIVDIPPGYTHNIINVGTEEMLVLFWSNEIFDSNKPDTYFLKV